MVGGIGPLRPGNGVRLAAERSASGGSVTPTFRKLTIYDVGAGFAGKRVLMRVDVNGTAADGKLNSTKRIDAALASIQYVLDQGAAQVILIAHNGRYEDIAAQGPEAFSLALVTAYLAQKLAVPVDFVRGFNGPITSGARVILMENTREDARDEAKDTAQNEAYARQIIAAANPDIYVLDGFSVAHRDQASVTWPAKLMQEQRKLAVAGYLLQREYEFFIDRVIKNPAQPFLVFLGGSKVSGKGGKLPILEALLPDVDRLVVGGAMAYPFMLEKGLHVEGLDPFAAKEGRSEELKAERDAARAILEGPNGHKVIVPHWVVVAAHVAVDVSQPLLFRKTGWVMRDLKVDEATFENLAQAGYRTIFFNGTFGYYEGGFVEGTTDILTFMARETEKGALTIPGGGDTIMVLETIFEKSEAGKKARFSHVTTGGGASGELITLGFAGRAEELPGFACLTDRG